jgi:hypothetical protein
MSTLRLAPSWNTGAREFFRLAAVWLECRLAELHGAGNADYGSDPFHAFMGQMDYQSEMGLLLKEHAERPSAPVFQEGAKRS